jgi:hypothetical protein
VTVFTSGTRKWLLYSTLITALTSIVMGIVAMQYANYAVRKSTQQWCDVVTTLDDAYKQTPPTSPAGQRLAQEMARLRIKFECKKGSHG